MPDEEAERRYQVGFARATYQGLNFADSPFAELMLVWRPGARATRYNRTWHLTRILQETEEYAFARIGFVADNEVSTLRFDDDRQEFVYGEAPSGTVVPFVIRKSDLTIAFQLRPGVVRETTFTGALRELLDDSWLIETFVRESDLATWRQSMQSIEQFKAVLDRPNPHYFDNDSLEDLMEGVHARVMQINASAIDGESINLDYPLFQQALDHVVTHGYGRVKLVGEQEDGTESAWVKQRGQSAKVPSTVIQRALGGDEAPEDSLIEALKKLPSEAQLSNLSAVDDDGS